MNAQRRKALAFVALAAASGGAAIAMVPRAGVVEMTASLPLETLFPATFKGWNIDPSIIPLEPSAELRKVIQESYDQTLSRTYVNAQGYRVMLSVAYGGRRNQGMDIHRPEVCYPAQGMAVRRDTREILMEFGADRLPLKRMVAGVGSRNEPISYWLVIGRSVASFGYGHRLALLKYGLTGQVPDGMLVRVSSLDDDEVQAFVEQDDFLRDMLSAMSPEFRRRLLGQA
ncbi:MAG: EpsI family protein [Rhizobacter sp.]|nr:EpsI family protein [Rhizobacter sp.]